MCTCIFLDQLSCQYLKFPNILKNNKREMIKIHKRYFRVAKGKNVPADISHSYNRFKQESQNKDFSWDKAYKNRKYKLMKQGNFCWAKQMMAGELAKTHNITYIKSRYESRNHYNFMASDVRYDFDGEWYEGMYLQYYSGYSFHYCFDSKARNTTIQLGYDTWIKPLDIESWAMIITTWLTVSLMYTLRVEWISILIIIYNLFSKLVDMFLILSCSHINDSRKGCLYTLLTLSGFLFWDLYNKEIMGLTTVEEKVKPFGSICELLTFGYRLNRYTRSKIYCEAYNVTSKDFYYQTNIDVYHHSSNYVRMKIGWTEQAGWNTWNSIF